MCGRVTLEDEIRLGLRRFPDPHLHTRADDKSRTAAYVLAIEALIQINDVTNPKRYEGSREPTVDGITLEIASGEAVAESFDLLSDLPVAAMPRSQSRARARGGAKGAR